MLPGAPVDIRFSPRIQWHLLLEIGAIPALQTPGVAPQGLQSFLGCRVTTHIQTEGVQGRTNKLNLGPGRLDLRFFLLAHKTRGYQSRKQANDHHDYEQLYKGKSAADRDFRQRQRKTSSSRFQFPVSISVSIYFRTVDHGY